MPLRSDAPRPFPFWPVALPLLLSAVYLSARWPSIPATFATHYDVHGAPNGWSDRSPLSVFGPLAFPLLLTAILELIGRAMRQTFAKHAHADELAAALRTLLRLVALALSSVIALVAARLPFGPVAPLPILVIGAALLALALAIGGTQLSRVLGAARAEGHFPHLRGHGVFMYHHDAQNPDLWVPKTLSPGYTLNYAHPWALPLTILMVAAPIAIVVVLVLLKS